MVLLSKSWNPSSSTEWQHTTLLVLGGLPAIVHRDLVLPVTAGEPYSHQRAQTPAPLLRGEKRQSATQEPSKGQHIQHTPL
jgi:hypothetical protein